MLSSSQIIMLMAIHQNDVPDHTVVHTGWWACHEVVQDRHQLYKLGLIEKSDRGWATYRLTEKGQVMVSTLLQLPLPEKKIITQWVIPGREAA